MNFVMMILRNINFDIILYFLIFAATLYCQYSSYHMISRTSFLWMFSSLFILILRHGSGKGIPNLWNTFRVWFNITKMFHVIFFMKLIHFVRIFQYNFFMLLCINSNTLDDKTYLLSISLAILILSFIHWRLPCLLLGSHNLLRWGDHNILSPLF